MIVTTDSFIETNSIIKVGEKKKLILMDGIKIMTNQGYIDTRWTRVNEYDIPASKLTTRKAQKIPNSPDEVNYSEVVIMNLAILFADIRGYTKRIDSSDSKVAARIMNLYVTEMAASIRYHGGTIISIEGDGIIGAFADTEKRNAQTIAARAVVTMNTILNYVVNKKLHSFQQEALGCGYGIESGKLYIIRAGVRGKGKNELVFIGSAMTKAAKYQSFASSNEVYISNQVYNSLEDFYKKSDEGWSWSSVYKHDFGTLYRKSVGNWSNTSEPST